MFATGLIGTAEHILSNLWRSVGLEDLKPVGGGEDFLRWGSEGGFFSFFGVGLQERRSALGVYAARSVAPRRWSPASCAARAACSGVGARCHLGAGTGHLRLAFLAALHPGGNREAVL